MIPKLAGSRPTGTMMVNWMRREIGKRGEANTTLLNVPHELGSAMPLRRVATILKEVRQGDPVTNICPENDWRDCALRVESSGATIIKYHRKKHTVHIL